MTTRNTYRKAFGEALRKELSASGTTANSLANSTGLSPAYVSRMLHGQRNAAPGWIDLIASTLNLTETATVELHKAAAKDLGYKLDLTKK